MPDQNSQPMLSVVIPTMGRDTLIRTVESLARAEDFRRLEVLVCGRIASPDVLARMEGLLAQHGNIRHFPVMFPVGDSSEKKNHGMRESRSEWVAFLDDDVTVAPAWPRLMRQAVEKEGVGLVSGPALVPPDAGLFARLAGLSLSSPAAGYVAWRYRQMKSEPTRIRWSQIIGCNMIYRKSVLQSLGGFDPKFWPGEEMIAAFLAERAGHGLMFQPQAWVYHYPRQSAARFWRQIAGYGATRIRLIRAGVECEPATLIPAMWVAALAILGAGSFFSGWSVLLLGLAVMAYVTAIALVTLLMFRESGQRRDLLLFFVIPVMHLSYGVGSWSEVVRPNRDLSEHLAHVTK